MVSCNYFDFSKKNKDIIIEERIKEIKANGLELYPKISSCKKLTSKACFEKQLTQKLATSLKETIIADKIKHTDTIWMTIQINNKGTLSLKKITAITDSKIKQTIQNTLKKLSPIQSATINGTPVNSNFKIPIILKTNN